MGIVSKFLGLHVESPSWSCGRLWLLRLGYFKLTRPKEHAADWAWIIDHTVQLGSEKCFVILGVRLSCLPAQCLRLEDMEPIMIAPVKKSNGQIVFDQLEEATQITGIPRQIVSDHGTDLVTGLDMFCEKHSGVCITYDIKHKTAAVLKRELKSDERWQSFIQMCTQTAQRVRQTDLAFLCPPNQRSKSRYMNIDILIGWGAKALAFLDDPSRIKVDSAELDEKLGWIREFQEELKSWEALLGVVSETESFIRSKGLYRGCHRDLKEHLNYLAPTEQSKRVRSELLSFVAGESFKAKPKERLIGSSEVIESAFGKLKHLEGNHAVNGFTGLLLALAAIVSTTTGEIIRKAMETAPTKDVLGWCKNKLGKTLQAKRKILAFSDSPEQITDEFETAFST